MDSSASAEWLHRLVLERGREVALLMIVSEQSAQGRFLEQDFTELSHSLEQSVGMVVTLCRLFGADMAVGGRGYILAVGGRSGAGCASAEMPSAFLRSLCDNFGGELAKQGIHLSFIENPGPSLELHKALEPTCLRFLAPEGKEREQKAGVSSQQDVGAEVVGRAVPKAAAEGDWSLISGALSYEEVAQKDGFRILPGAARVDHVLNSPVASLINVIIVVTLCATYALSTLELTPKLVSILGLVDNIGLFFFIADYLARWWSRGLRADYVMRPAMLFDLASILPDVLRLASRFVPWLAVGGVKLTFLKIGRIFRFYRFFTPRAMRSLIEALPGKRRPEQINEMVKPWKLRLAQAVWVLLSLMCVNAGILYEAEHLVNDRFSDFFSTLYFSIIVLSTVGFGDIAPITPIGRLVTSVAIIAGLCIVPFEASAVASAVAKEQSEQKELKRARDRKGEDAINQKVEEGRARLAASMQRITQLYRQQANRTPGMSLAMTQREQLMRMFQELDTNNDQYLSNSEVAGIWNNAPSKDQAKEVAKRVMAMADSNLDGKVSFEEFERWVTLPQGWEET